MSNEPRLSSSDMPVVDTDQRLTNELINEPTTRVARLESDDSRAIGRTIGRVADIEREDPGPRPLMVAIIGFAICVVSLGGASLLGESSGLYRLLFGEGGAHLLSQLCTLILFSWGIASVVAWIISLRGELNALATHHRSLTDVAHAQSSPLINQYEQDTGWGLRHVNTYIECRAVIDEARERLIERLEVATRGASAAMWLIPLSGFLGTVIGMSLTIGRFDDLFASASGENVKLIGLTDLAPAIQGLSTAFDTTLLALALVIPLKLALVALERYSEELIEGVERLIGEPLLAQKLSNAPAQVNADSASSFALALGVLNEQSTTLNLRLAETVRYLSQLREELLSHPSLSAHAQVDLAQTIERAISLSQRERGESQSQDQEFLIALQNLTAHQSQLGEQLLALRESVEAPLLVQRAPRQLQES